MGNIYSTLALTALLLTGCTSPPEKPPPGTSLPPCGPLPNCVNTESSAGDQAIEPLQASFTQWQALKAWLASQQNWTITADDGDLVQAVATTPVMRYRDDVLLRYDAARNVVHVRSSSRLGIGDMGANYARVEQLRKQLASTPSQP
ncbi:hypothetical protein A3709_02295 [Halioglobus sp. HI00S01]|uniref:DUF1499 domain-containing protein n=1 Tax=Halioglobus sp. HI00S01 TaxID=1822214 RepID=UPI0007C2E941|nr:DUF1499 domain-containing protein [Halioglobus sp. HI00S01]KZX58315.1 hypothetical protein A3709_02295 [Halioglobus sp. HI00S01]